MKNFHSVRYYEKRLFKLQTVADSIGYHIDSDADYLRACRIMPISATETVSPAFLAAYMAVCERVNSVRRVTK